MLISLCFSHPTLHIKGHTLHVSPCHLPHLHLFSWQVNQNHRHHILWVKQRYSHRKNKDKTAFQRGAEASHISFKVRQLKAYLVKKCLPGFCLQGSNNLKWLVSTAYILFPVWLYRKVTHLLEPNHFFVNLCKSITKCTKTQGLPPYQLLTSSRLLILRFPGRDVCRKKVKNSWPLFPNISLPSSFWDIKQKQTIWTFNTIFLNICT